MKTIKVLLLGYLLALYVGSYTSAHGLKTEKVYSDELVKGFCSSDHSVILKNDLPNQYAVMYTDYWDRQSPTYFVPLTIGKVINKPLTNNRYKGLERWYSCSSEKVC